MSVDPTPPETPPEHASASRSVVWTRWDEVDALLESALDLPTRDREAFIRSQCDDDPALADAVLALAGFGTRQAADPAPGAGILRAALAADDGETDDPEALLGSRLGPYRLTRVLGSGGMGSVYGAERADETFERTVAIKVLRRAVATREMADRFAMERQILATLSHPSIAQLLDGGVTDDGRPFLVMELVEGTPIDAWADEHRLGVDERIRLVLQVMEAVEHAHRHMVVHRDLKPSNILVRDDGSVKLLDFGIARLLDEPEGSAAATRTGRRFLTPEYAAPEQLLGEPASAQTDVYSLAALLYELLTGTRPYTSRPGVTMLEQVVRGGEPTAPSVALTPADTSAGGGAGGAVFAARSTTPSALRRRLSGDLDAVLTRALRARPTERYASVVELRDDLQRHLAGHPVLARGNARAYRMRKFVGRHRIPVAALSGVFLLAAGSAIGLAVQRGDLIEQRNRAEGATTLASQEAERARATTDFLVNLFEASDPGERLGDTLTARALLERGVERIDVDLGDQPTVRAELLGILGVVHSSLGLHGDAIALQERAVALRRDSISGSPGLGVALSDLGEAHFAQRSYEKARDSFRAAIVRTSEEGDSTAVARAHLGLGQALTYLDQPDSAEAELRAGLAMLPERPTNSPEVLNAEHTLAGIVRRRGNLAEADSLLVDLVARRRASTGGSPIDYVAALNDLAVVRRLEGQHDDAIALYAEVLDTLELVLGPVHPTTLDVRGNLATAYSSAGRNVEASAAYESTLATMREAWPEGHWRIARTLTQLGASLIESDRPEEALAPLSEAVDMGIEQIGNHHIWTNVFRGWLGMAAELSGRRDVAARFHVWSIVGFTQYEGLPEDRVALGMIESLVSIMHAQGLEERATEIESVVWPEGRF